MALGRRGMISLDCSEIRRNRKRRPAPQSMPSSSRSSGVRSPAVTVDRTDRPRDAPSCSTRSHAVGPGCAVAAWEPSPHRRPDRSCPNARAWYGSSRRTRCRRSPSPRACPARGRRTCGRPDASRDRTVRSSPASSPGRVPSAGCRSRAPESREPSGMLRDSANSSASRRGGSAP